jgi:hypothetical protein
MFDRFGTVQRVAECVEALKIDAKALPKEYAGEAPAVEISRKEAAPCRPTRP